MPKTERPGSVVPVSVKAVEGGSAMDKDDLLATEEPLEIRVVTPDGRGSGTKHSVAVTMRTPGNDFELAAGFLFSEGAVKRGDDIESIAYCTDPLEPQNYNIVNVTLSPGLTFDADRLSRKVYTTSSCGICGKASIELVRSECAVRPVGTFQIDGGVLGKLPEKMKEAQSLFAKTGGIHASALFDPEGRLLLLREDVGRHNALDKVVGALLLQRKLPASDTLLLVSGRASFELVQKAVMAGIPVVAAIGAPSSLSRQLAEEYGVTLAGFVRGDRFNIYCNGQRLSI
ncbi:MAG: formate dehydrogenase accessory sulfurtransferase FdhD [Nitrososphaerota archaeon]|nr:formate dehydrogenase accessory sulfurtransferase FdhD [Nitrososphaerota archaeon]